MDRNVSSSFILTPPCWTIFAVFSEALSLIIKNSRVYPGQKNKQILVFWEL